MEFDMDYSMRDIFWLFIFIYGKLTDRIKLCVTRQM